ncbi:MAG: prephenate dehydrogenase/arogenate dehydrogenase family protein [Chloroflexi bacterium]|nr:prephenate dehydrogenase/arogenate dehydrogenase family protein [Chloroflexota bacterium]
MPRVAILGTGLIGTSIGLRLHSHGRTSDLSVVGWDRNPDHAREARERGAIAETAASVEEAVAGAWLVVLAAPVLALRSLLEDVGAEAAAGRIAANAVVTDTGSTKADVMRWATETLPASVSFVGGHPMAGKTEPGPAAADGALFEGARWVLVPSRSAPGGAVETVTSLINTMGAEAMFMDAEEHDAYVAAVSHLPLAAAVALFTLVRESEAWPEMSMLASSGFLGATRLAQSDTSMAYDIFATNREQVAHWLERYGDEIARFRERLLDDEGGEALFRALGEANLDYARLASGDVGRDAWTESPRDIPSMSAFDLLLGGALSDKMREWRQGQEESRERGSRRRR